MFTRCYDPGIYLYSFRVILHSMRRIEELKRSWNYLRNVPSFPQNNCYKNGYWLSEFHLKEHKISTINIIFI